MTNWWEKVNVSAAVAGVIVAATLGVATIYQNEIKCFFNSQ